MATSPATTVDMAPALQLLAIATLLAALLLALWWWRQRRSGAMSRHVALAATMTVRAIAAGTPRPSTDAIRPR